MSRKVLKYTVAVGLSGLLSACSITSFTTRMRHSRSVIESAFHEHTNQMKPPEVHLVLEILDRPLMRDTMPADKEISWEEYCRLKTGYTQKNNRWKPGYALTYRLKEGDEWRGYWLTLESFDDQTVWIAELTQYKSTGWDWVARYRIKRSPQVDEELSIAQIFEYRSGVIGAVKYGMTVSEVLAKKGRHFKVNHHAEGGSADLVYDDVKVSVRGWWSNREGRVVGVEPTTKQTLEFLKGRPYEDER